MHKSTNISATKYEYSHFKKDQAISKQLKTTSYRILKYFFFPEIWGFRNYGSWAGYITGVGSEGQRSSVTCIQGHNLLVMSQE